jgi:transposase-like protein
VKTSLAPTVAGIIAALLSGSGLTVLVGALTGRRMRRVEVADRLSDSSLKWVQEFQEETQRARLEASEARREVAEVRREVGEVRREAEKLAADLRNLRGAIMSPTATIERLRAMVGGTGDVPNGRPD